MKTWKYTLTWRYIRKALWLLTAWRKSILYLVLSEHTSKSLKTIDYHPLWISNGSYTSKHSEDLKIDWHKAAHMVLLLRYELLTVSCLLREEDADRNSAWLHTEETPLYWGRDHQGDTLWHFSAIKKRTIEYNIVHVSIAIIGVVQRGSCFTTIVHIVNQCSKELPNKVLEMMRNIRIVQLTIIAHYRTRNLLRWFLTRLFFLSFS